LARVSRLDGLTFQIIKIKQGLFYLNVRLVVSRGDLSARILLNWDNPRLSTLWCLEHVALGLDGLIRCFAGIPHGGPLCLILNTDRYIPLWSIIRFGNSCLVEQSFQHIEIVLITEYFSDVFSSYLSVLPLFKGNSISIGRWLHILVIDSVLFLLSLSWSFT